MKAGGLMTWNYRVIFDKKNKTLGVHEVYYDEHGVANTWTVLPVSITSDLDNRDPSVFTTPGLLEAEKEMRSEFGLMLCALNRPFLYERTEHGLPVLRNIKDNQVATRDPQSPPRIYALSRIR